MRNPPRDRMRRVDRSDDLAVVVGAPPQGATGAHEFHEDLRPVAGVQHHESHAGEHMAVHPVDDLVGYFVVGDVAPPDEYVGFGEEVVF